MGVIGKNGGVIPNVGPVGTVWTSVVGRASWEYPESAGLSDGDYGDVTVSGGGASITIDNDVVTPAKLDNGAALSVLGRSANSIGDRADVVAGADGDVLRRSGTTVGFGSIVEASVTGLVADLAAKVPLTRAINTTAPVTGGGDLSADRTIAVSDFVASGASHARGTVPDPGASAGTTRYLREDATWVTPPGAGELALSKKAPTSNATVTAGYCCYVSDEYECVSGVETEIGLLATLEVG